MKNKTPDQKVGSDGATHAEKTAPEPRAKLSSRQEIFACLYASGKTATQAYKTAYGPSKGAKVSASKLLTFTNIQTRIEELRKPVVEACAYTLQQTFQWIRRVVETPIGEVNASSTLCQLYEARESESGSYVKVKMPDKLRALELNARLAGYFNESVKVEPVDTLLEVMKKIRGGAFSEESPAQAGGN